MEIKTIKKPFETFEEAFDHYFNTTINSKEEIAAIEMMIELAVTEDQINKVTNFIIPPNQPNLFKKAKKKYDEITKKGLK